ncbi:MAG: PIN domain-containing protein [Paenibacillaceae bacterium]
MERVMNGDYSKVAIDSNCFIYLIEGSPYVDQLTQLFQKIENSSLVAVTSILTLIEILVGPYKSKDYKLIEEYRTTLLNFPNLAFREMDFNIAIKAAQCRADYGLKMPDAIQLATAILDKADVFITNDRDFKNVVFPVIFL